jgi:hypothetical protein
VKDILDHFKIQSIKIITNNPRKISELSKLGVVVTERISAEVSANSVFSAKYQYYDDFRIDCGSAKLEIKGFLLLVVVAGCFFH